jgi:hypothetical protein
MLSVPGQVDLVDGPPDFITISDLLAMPPVSVTHTHTRARRWLASLPRFQLLGESHICFNSPPRASGSECVSGECASVPARVRARRRERGQPAGSGGIGGRVPLGPCSPHAAPSGAGLRARATRRGQQSRVAGRAVRPRSRR